MSKKQEQHKAFRADDYDDPTEPVKPVALPYAVEPTTPIVGGWFPKALNVPAPQAGIHPFPQEYAPVYPYAQPPTVAAYPMHPPESFQKKPGREFAPIYQRARKQRRSLVPGLVSLCFLLIQAALLVRVGCMLLSVEATTLWLSLLFLVSNFLVEPLRMLAANVNLGPLTGTQMLIYLEFLLAILAYGVVSRLLVGLLKALYRRN